MPSFAWRWNNHNYLSLSNICSLFHTTFDKPITLTLTFLNYLASILMYENCFYKLFNIIFMIYEKKISTSRWISLGIFFVLLPWLFLFDVSYRYYKDLGSVLSKHLEQDVWSFDRSYHRVLYQEHNLIVASYSFHLLIFGSLQCLIQDMQHLENLEGLDPYVEVFSNLVFLVPVLLLEQVAVLALVKLAARAGHQSNLRVDYLQALVNLRKKSWIITVAKIQTVTRLRTNIMLWIVVVVDNGFIFLILVHMLQKLSIIWFYK